MKGRSQINSNNSSAVLILTFLIKIRPTNESGQTFIAGSYQRSRKQRHADAGYDEAIKMAKERRADLPVMD